MGIVVSRIYLSSFRGHVYNNGFWDKLVFRKIQVRKSCRLVFRYFFIVAIFVVIVIVIIIVVITVLVVVVNVIRLVDDTLRIHRVRTERECP